jgi:antitoxin component of MazEF toxin-antitoxin module
MIRQNVDTVITCMLKGCLMQTIELKIARIGNSRGVRIPAEVLRRYAFGDAAIMVESVDGILLRPKQQTDAKLSWADTAKAMAAESGDWSEWDTVASDGLGDIPWETANVAEKRNGYGAKSNKSSRRRP